MNDATPAGRATGVEVDDRAGTSTSTLHRDGDIPEQRRCTYTDTWCRCTVPDSATMHACARHFLGEVSGHG